MTEFSRRSFLRASGAAGGGLLLSLSLSVAGDAQPRAFVPNAFVRIGDDGKVLMTMPYVEMGQGTYTSIPMLIAEELEVELNQVQVRNRRRTQVSQWCRAPSMTSTSW